MTSTSHLDIDALLAALGGVRVPDVPEFGSAPLLADFLAATGLELDDAFVHLTSRYGGGAFAGEVEFTALERVPIARAGNRMSLGRLLGWHRGDQGIPHIHASYADQLPVELLPLAEVGSGDYLCVAVAVHDRAAALDDSDGDGPVPHERADELRARRGAIWYWHHEAPEDEDLFLVADDLLSFLRGLARRPPTKPDTSGFVGSRGNAAFWARMTAKAEANRPPPPTKDEARGAVAPEIRPDDPAFWEDESFWASLSAPAPARGASGPHHADAGVSPVPRFDFWCLTPLAVTDVCARLGSAFGLPEPLEWDFENVWEWGEAAVFGGRLRLNVSRRHLDGEPLPAEVLRVLVDGVASPTDLDLLGATLAAALGVTVWFGAVKYLGGDEFAYHPEREYR